MLAGIVLGDLVLTLLIALAVYTPWVGWSLGGEGPRRVSGAGRGWPGTL